MIPIAKPSLGDEEKKAVGEVIESGIIAEGPKVAEFEKEFSRYIGTEFGIAVSSGTAALHIALLAAGIQEEDEVIIPSFSFIATANSVLYCRAKPVFVDIEDETYNIDPEKIESAITDKTKAIMPVHLYGHPAEMKKIMSIAKKNKLFVIEDACQAHGAEYRSVKAGSIGDAGCFSFYPTKNMTTGEGGIITTDNEQVAEKARVLRQHGMEQRYHHHVLGFNYRMTDLAASIGLCQLKKLDEFNNKRIQNANYLTKKLGGLEWVKTPSIKEDCKHVFHQYTIKVGGKEREDILSTLRENGIKAEVYYPIPIHLQKLYTDLGYNQCLEKTEECSNKVLSLPIHPGVGEKDFDFIHKTLSAIQ